MDILLIWFGVILLIAAPIYLIVAVSAALDWLVTIFQKPPPPLPEWPPLEEDQEEL